MSNYSRKGTIILFSLAALIVVLATSVIYAGDVIECPECIEPPGLGGDLPPGLGDPPGLARCPCYFNPDFWTARRRWKMLSFPTGSDRIGLFEECHDTPASTSVSGNATSPKSSFCSVCDPPLTVGGPCTACFAQLEVTLEECTAIIRCGVLTEPIVDPTPEDIFPIIDVYEESRSFFMGHFGDIQERKCRDNVREIIRIDGLLPCS